MLCLHARLCSPHTTDNGAALAAAVLGRMRFAKWSQKHTLTHISVLSLHYVMKHAGPDIRATRNAVRVRIHHHTSQALPDSTRQGTNYPCIDFVYFVMRCDAVSSWLTPQAAWMSRSAPRPSLLHELAVQAYFERNSERTSLMKTFIFVFSCFASTSAPLAFALISSVVLVPIVLSRVKLT